MGSYSTEKGKVSSKKKKRGGEKEIINLSYSLRENRGFEKNRTNGRREPCGIINDIMIQGSWKKSNRNR